MTRGQSPDNATLPFRIIKRGQGQTTTVHPHGHWAEDTPPLLETHPPARRPRLGLEMGEVEQISHWKRFGKQPYATSTPPFTPVM